MTAPSLHTLALGALGALLDDRTVDANSQLACLRVAAATLTATDPAPEAAVPAVAAAIARQGLRADEETPTVGASERSGPDIHAESLRRLRAAPTQEDARVVGLATALDLEPLELIAFGIALAVERDALAGRAIACLQAPLAASYPTLGLLERALQRYTNADARPVVVQLASGRAVHAGMLVLQGAELPLPLPEQTLRVPNDLVMALAGAPDRSMEPPPSIALPDSILAKAARHGVALAAGGGVLVVRAAVPDEARAVAAEICTAAGRLPRWVSGTSGKGLAPLCHARDQWPVFRLDPGPGEEVSVPLVPGYSGAVLAVAGNEGQVRHPSARVVEWRIGLPGVAERAALWRGQLLDHELAETLARQYMHGAGRIDEIADLARHRARFEVRELMRGTDVERSASDSPLTARLPVLTVKDVQGAAWASNSAALSGLTQPIDARIGDSALVVGRQQRDELEFLVCRCRNREGLDEHLGETIRATYHTGVKALFVGPSGTGKTLTASWLATRLGMPLYRVDLASIVSKYIGETEKNLANLLWQAEQSDVILLFDEADSIFAKRTDVKDSNDRHANSQTNYLLQRIETYKGIVLLTSNSKSRFDSAFARRLDSVIEFALPTPELRRRMWDAHLGAAHELTTGELNQLAVESTLAGGQIRNAALGAAVLARERCGSIAFADVLAAVIDEYRKLGQQAPVTFRQRLSAAPPVQGPSSVGARTTYGAR